MTSNALAAGWHRDPDDPNSFRWFDGSSYTDERRPAGPGMQAPTAGELYVDDAAWERFPYRQERVYPGWDAAALAQDDKRKAKLFWRERAVIILGALGLMALGPAAVAVLPIGIVIALVIMFVKRGEAKKARAALTYWAQMLGFQDEGGGILAGDKAPPLALGTADEPLRALRAAGMPIQFNEGARLRGTPWTAAPGTMIQEIRGYREYKWDYHHMTVLTIPLPPEVASRFAGLAAERPRIKRRFRLRGNWGPFAGTPEGMDGWARITAHPNQRTDAGYFPIVQLRDDWSWGLDGWVVAEGQLTLWASGDLLTGTALMQMRLSAGKRQKKHATAQMRLMRLIDQARILQYLLYEEVR